MQYRFVIIVLIDRSEGRQIVDLCSDKKSSEFSLFAGLAESMNIFSVIGPDGPSSNIAFILRGDPGHFPTLSIKAKRLMAENRWEGKRTRDPGIRPGPDDGGYFRSSMLPRH
jgi:hypothetical protein